MAGIELDDPSHKRRDRQERDCFVNEVFEQTALPLVRIKAANDYNREELRSRLNAAVKQRKLALR